MVIIIPLTQKLFIICQLAWFFYAKCLYKHGNLAQTTCCCYFSQARNVLLLEYLVANYILSLTMLKLSMVPIKLEVQNSGTRWGVIYIFEIPNNVFFENFADSLLLVCTAV